MCTGAFSYRRLGTADNFIATLSKLCLISDSLPHATTSDCTMFPSLRRSNLTHPSVSRRMNDAVLEGVWAGGFPYSRSSSESMLFFCRCKRFLLDIQLESCLHINLA
jgi:hypothetical protein